MTMIDLLVQELPKRGGWPAGAVEAMSFNHNSGMIHFFDEEENKVIDAIKIDGYKAPFIDTVTAEQYEAAFAASNKVEWNGFGVPPVGQKCKRSAFGDDWAECEVLYVGPEVIVVSVEGREKAYKTGSVKFHPLLTEAERKREEVGVALFYTINWNHQDELVSESRMEDYRKAYDAIADGKIPYITLK